MFNIWKVDPFRNEDILFYVDNGTYHIGQIYSSEKLRKCSFYSFQDKKDYDCDSTAHAGMKVTHWMPLPKPPEKT